MSVFKEAMSGRTPDRVMIELDDDVTVLVTAEELDAGFDVHPDENWVFVTLAAGREGVAYPRHRIRAIRVHFAPVETWAGTLHDEITLRPEAGAVAYACDDCGDGANTDAMHNGHCPSCGRWDAR